MISAGIGLSPSGQLRGAGISSTVYTNSSDILFAASFEETRFLPRLNVQYGYTVSDQIQLNVSGGFRPLRNAAMSFSSTEVTDSTALYYLDSFYVRSNAAELNAELRFYNEYILDGFFTSLGAGVSITGNKIVAVYNTFSGANTTTEVKSPAYQRNAYYSVTLGAGYTKSIGNQVLDFGARLNLYVFPKVFLNQLFEDYQFANGYRSDTEFDTYLQAVNAKNLQKFNTLEIYLRYGITW